MVQQIQVDTTSVTIPANTWGAKFLADEPLMIQRAGLNSYVSGEALYPVSAEEPPIEVIILGKDVGKRGIKGASVNNYLKTTVAPAAYRALSSSRVQKESHLGAQAQSEEEDAAHYLWKISNGEGEVSEEFVCGDDALRFSEMLDVNVRVSDRFDDPRMKGLFFASLVLDLQGLGYKPTTVEEGVGEVPKTHNLYLNLGVPVKEVNDQQAVQAGQSLKGKTKVTQLDLASGQQVAWNLNIVDVTLDAQPKGSLFAITRHLDGSPATNKKDIVIFDFGGGDTHRFGLNITGGKIAEAVRIGNGTIDIAEALRELVDQDYGIEISLIEAQEALYKRVIWKGGEPVDISHLIAQLKPRYKNLLAKVQITNNTLSNFLIFTGGAAALFREELLEKVLAKAPKAKEGIDFIIMPTAIAAVANAIGLFALGFYKVQARISKFANEYLDLVAECNLIESQSMNLASSGMKKKEAQDAFNDLQAKFQSLSERRNKHVGQHYPEVIEQVRQHREMRQLQAAAAGGK